MESNSIEVILVNGKVHLHLFMVNSPKIVVVLRPETAIDAGIAMIEAGRDATSNPHGADLKLRARTD